MGNQFLILNFFIVGLCWLSARISFSTFFKLGRPEKQTGIQVYVLVWLLLLGALVAFIPVPVSQPAGWICVALALYRFQDLGFASLDDALDLSDTYKTFDWRGRVLILLTNVVEIVLIFTIQLIAFAGETKTRLDFLIQSWTSLPPLGSGSASVTLLSAAEAATGLLIFTIALTAFLQRGK